MAKFLQLSIRFQLMVLAILLSLPALGIILYSGIGTRAEDYNKAAVESQKLCDNLTSELEQLILETDRLGSFLAELPEIKGKNSVRAYSVLQNAITKYPNYLSIIIADDSGKVWASTYSKHPNESIYERRYFKNAQLSKRFSSGEYVLSLASRSPTIHLAYPILDQGSFRGVVAMGFKLDILRKILVRSQLPKNSNYILVDHKGIIVSRGTERGQNVGKPMLLDDFKRMESGLDKETYEFNLSADDRRITTYRKVQLPGETSTFLYVRAGLSLKEAVARANHHLIYDITVMLPFVFIAFLLAFIIGKHSIVDRIDKLQNASEKIAHGDLDTRVSHLVTGGELGALGKSFDYMAQRLSESIKYSQYKADEYSAIIQTTSDGFCITDGSGNFLVVNESYCKLLGYSMAELMDKNIADIEVTEKSEIIATRLFKIINEGSDLFATKYTRKNGTEIDVEITITYLNKNDGGRFYSFVRDITDRKKLEADLLRSATYDNLTGIYNRNALDEKIETEMQRVQRHGNIFSLIMLDVDDFKHINDSLGHHAGDKVLKSIGELLSNNVRLLDSVGRWGGEEFMILLPETNKSEALIVAEKLRTTLADYRIGEFDNVTASIGVTTYQTDDTLDSLLKRVDDLMYSAKTTGKNRIVT
jgi:diguanylate cyclase (GGDEF)-like protein/PAS domain S-box-containing protein